MTPQQKSELRWFFPETLIYAVLVAAYCWAVFHFFGPVLRKLSAEHRLDYAMLALALMVVQGFLLERIAHAIITMFHRDKKVAS
jgi:uncharacterized membrane protein HdeD (DUF308 family)